MRRQTYSIKLIAALFVLLLGATYFASSNRASAAPEGFGLIGDLVWHDSNANGALDGGEVGIGGVTVELYDANEFFNNPDSRVPLQTTTTLETASSGNPVGWYEFTVDQVGTYAVYVPPGQNALTGYALTTTEDPLGNPIIVSQQSLQEYYDADFGYAQPSIDIEKATNGEDADSAPGPFIPAGNEVNWTYVVTNNGELDLTGISVTDDRGVAVSCSGTSLPVGDSITCTGTGSAVVGSYENIGSVEGTYHAQTSYEGVVTDSDPSHYFGGSPAIVVEKATNGEDADNAPGPFIATGPGNVTWTYVVTNTGNVTLTNVAVTDDVEGPICDIGNLPPNQSETCVLVGDAEANQYENLATATGQFGIVPVQDTDPSHYYGSEPGIVIEKATNGQDADNAPGPVVLIGSTVEWTYVVTNTGNVPLTSVTVTDDHEGAICDGIILAPNQSTTCTASSTANAGQYDNLATVTGGSPTGATVDDTDPSHYFGSDAAIDIEKATNGEDADQPTGPVVNVGDAVNWTYTVTNVGNVDLTNVTVTDSDPDVTVTCPDNDPLPIGESMICTASGAAITGQYMNTGTAVGDPVGPGPSVQASDPSHYFGSGPSIVIEKATNGEDADQPTGPVVDVGDPVNWTYVVTNTGNVVLTGVTVTDDQGVAVDCPQSTLNAGVAMTCTASGTATVGQYMNTATVTGTPPAGDDVSDADVSHYFGYDASIDVEKSTNGENADDAPGPFIPVGADVTWTFDVTNTGLLTLSQITLNDTVLGAVTCPQTTLAPNESMTCTVEGTAAEGPHQNTATTTGVPPAGPNVEDSDPSHYFGSTPAVEIEKLTNDEDADSADDAPTVVAGQTVTWTYIVTNVGNVTLSNVTVTDDQEGLICDGITLTPDQSTTCTQTGVAAAVPYSNLGTVTGDSPNGNQVTDEDPSHYFGSQATYTIVKTLVQEGHAADGIVVVNSDPVTFSIVVHNTGNTDLDVVPLEDQFNPDYLQFENAVPEPDTEGQGTLTWNDLTDGGSLAPDEEIEVLVSFLPVQSTDELPNQQTLNLAAVSGVVDDTGQTLPDQEDDAPIRITNPAISISKTTTDPANGIVAVDEPVVFTIRVENIGDTTLVEIPVRDLYESDILEYDSTSLNAELEITTAGGEGTLFWPDITTDLGDLGPAEFHEFTVTFILRDDQTTTNLAQTGTSTDENGDTVNPVEGASGADVIAQEPGVYGLYMPIINGEPEEPEEPGEPGGTGDEECPPNGCPLPDVAHPKGIEVHEGLQMLYIVSRDTNKLLKYDPQTNEVVGSADTGNEPWDVAINEGTNRVYVSNFAGGDVWIYDAITMELLDMIGVSQNPAMAEVLPELNTIAVTVRAQNGVALVRNDEFAELLSGGGAGTFGIAADPDNNRIFVSNRDTGNGRVHVWTVSGWQQDVELHFGERGERPVPFDLAYNPSNEKLYAIYTANSRWYVDIFKVSANPSFTEDMGEDSPQEEEAQNRLMVIKETRVEVGSSGATTSPDVGGVGLEVNPVNDHVYTANTADGTVSVISGDTNTVLATVEVGVDPYDITVNATTETVYVTLRQSNRLVKFQDNY